ncbi:hypothetical protein [Terriglobus sp. RCC_193]|uniref:hypothetical protein n=1 Tax=Terriglobus sp. RCC_193 TaxID=3239218 RepID=UPI0035261E59
MHPRTIAVAVGLFFSTAIIFAQAPQASTPVASTRPPARPAPLVSPQLGSDGRVTFRIFAPQATAVALAGDIGQGITRDSATPLRGAQANAAGIPMTKDVSGVWTGTSLLPLKPGAWRYHFQVDGMSVVDTRNVNVSPYQSQMESLLISSACPRNRRNAMRSLVRPHEARLSCIPMEYSQPGFCLHFCPFACS